MLKLSPVSRSIHIAPMEVSDIPQVVAIDRQSFPLPWSELAYRRELEENPMAQFIVAIAPTEDCLRRVVGYAGFWLIVDEAHINTVAVHPQWRRRGVGARLLVALLERATACGAVLATLEVRVSNLAAQNLYRRYGFAVVGRRKRYYQDNFEDALLMTVCLENHDLAELTGASRGEELH